MTQRLDRDRAFPPNIRLCAEDLRSLRMKDGAFDWCLEGEDQREKDGNKKGLKNPTSDWRKWSCKMTQR